MDVEVTVPTEYQSNIMSQLVKRRGTITNTQTKTGLFIINADVPLAAMFGYATELRGATQGIGEFSMEYRKHSPVAAPDWQGGGGRVVTEPAVRIAGRAPGLC